MMANAEELERIEVLERSLQAQLKLWRMSGLFPDEGRLRRELYVRHLAFFRAGARHRERLFMAGNRVGKTIAGAYELTCHLTGRYPHWWEGRRFSGEVHAWACGTTLETSRDIVQLELLGPETAMGTGMIPAADIIWPTMRYRPNTNKALDRVSIRRQDGTTSTLQLKSYDQGRKAFEGTAKHVVWCDEEPPLPIYNEVLTRTGTTGGIVMVTFTPLEGATDVVVSFMEKAELLT